MSSGEIQGGILTWKNSNLLELVEEYPPPGWDFFIDPGTKKLLGTVSKKLPSTYPLYPPLDLVFIAFEMVPARKVKVVLIGQDPYHGKGQAIGRSFAVGDGTRPPPSLKNIYLEVAAQGTAQGWTVADPKKGSDLRKWERQGVLLLNTSLTVEEGRPGSNAADWSDFSARLVKWMDRNLEPTVFLLWGKHAQKIASGLSKKHVKVECAHPSPFSARSGFFGSECFLKVNAALKKLGRKEIDWSL